MTQIGVVGGVYAERCAFPEWDQVFGSAGRAAVALSGLVDNVVLHTAFVESHRPRIAPIFESYGIKLEFADSSQLIGFEYLHPLDEPQIFPSLERIDPAPNFSVESEVVVQFGMLECTPSVRAKHCVYDPQSPLHPVSFRKTGGAADQLAVILNAGEAARLTGSDDDLAQAVLKYEGAQVVVVKRGLDGAEVATSAGEQAVVPAYKTDNVFTIGSGDVFVSAFTYAWAIESMPVAKAAEYASKAVAMYVNSQTLPIASPSRVAKFDGEAVQRKGGKIYLAGPFRQMGQRWLVDDARRRLRELGMEVFSPVHDIGHGPAEKVVHKDLAAIDECDAMFAIFNGTTPGSMFEVGYARAKGKPVFGVAQNVRDVDLKLPKGSGCVIHRDYVSALHQVAWRS